DAALKSGSPAGATSPFSIGLKSFMVAATNPKGYLFFSAFLPQFIDPTMPQATQYMPLADIRRAESAAAEADLATGGALASVSG
ncbi:hypothetical protein ACC758_39095, partial [Rhizobium ruizarguesonis]